MSMKKTVTVASLAILLIGAAQCLAGQNVPALKDVFKDTFLIGGSALLFDRNCLPKQAFFAVVKTAQGK